jgi:hypothetical protein
MAREVHEHAKRQAGLTSLRGLHRSWSRAMGKADLWRNLSPQIRVNAVITSSAEGSTEDRRKKRGFRTYLPWQRRRSTEIFLRRLCRGARRSRRGGEPHPFADGGGVMGRFASSVAPKAKGPGHRRRLCAFYVASTGFFQGARQRRAYSIRVFLNDLQTGCCCGVRLRAPLLPVAQGSNWDTEPLCEFGLAQPEHFPQLSRGQWLSVRA